MLRTGRVPEDTDLVVPASARRAMREHGPTVAIFVLTAAASAYGVAATGSMVWLVIGLLCVAGVVLELLLVRAQARSGPLLAADAEHVWVRAGGFLAPRSVRLEWAEVTAVTLHLWQGRRNATARYLSFDLTDDAGAALAADPGTARRARRLTTLFGSPVAVAEQEERVLDGALDRLRTLAPEHVKFTQKS